MTLDSLACPTKESPEYTWPSNAWGGGALPAALTPRPCHTWTLMSAPFFTSNVMSCKFPFRVLMCRQVKPREEDNPGSCYQANNEPNTHSKIALCFSSPCQFWSCRSCWVLLAPKLLPVTGSWRSSWAHSRLCCSQAKCRGVFPLRSCRAVFTPWRTNASTTLCCSR